MALDVDQISKSFRGADGAIDALRDVSVAIEAGEFVAVTGASGCGKTTLLLAAGGLQSVDSGTVKVAGVDLYALSADARAAHRAKTIGFVFQQFHLIPYLTVLDNVLAPTLAHPVAGAKDRARELLARFGLEKRARHVPAKLSTGERQRTALARALLASPALLLADEPTGNLDRENADIVLEHVSQFAAKGGAVLLVTHDPHAASFAGRTLEMVDGRIGSTANSSA